MSETYAYSLSIAWALYILILIVWIIMEKRPILATLCWVLALAFLPYVGFVIYYYIGPQKITRHKANIHQSRSIFKQTNAHLRNKQLTANLPTQAQALAHIIYNTSNYGVDLAYNYQQISGGAASFEQMFSDILQAKEFIFLEYYIYEPGHIGDRLRDLLTEKAAQGVRVYLLLDSFGSSRINQKYMNCFLAAGGKLAFFHENVFFPTLRRFRPLLNMRTHRKILVCDGHIGITGGVNISDRQDLRLHDDAYQDLNVRFIGPAVQQLMRIFTEDWHYTTGEKITNLNYAPPPIVNYAAANLVHVFPSGPDNQASPLLHTILTAINQAKYRIWLTTPYFIPTEQTAFALTSAALRGIDVQLMMPESCHSKIITLATHSWYDALLESGIKIYQYPSSNLIHSKSILVDDLSIIGTSNFDNRSFMLNFEVTVINYQASAAQMLQQQFEHDRRRCQHFTQLSKERSFFTRLLESTARLTSPLL